MQTTFFANIKQVSIEEPIVDRKGQKYSLGSYLKGNIPHILTQQAHIFSLIVNTSTNTLLF